MSWDNNDRSDQWNGGGDNFGGTGGFDGGSTRFDDAGPGGGGSADRPRGACYNCGEDG